VGHGHNVQACISVERAALKMRADAEERKRRDEEETAHPIVVRTPPATIATRG